MGYGRRRVVFRRSGFWSPGVRLIGVRWKRGESADNPFRRCFRDISSRRGGRGAGIARRLILQVRPLFAGRRRHAPNHSDAADICKFRLADASARLSQLQHFATLAGPFARFSRMMHHLAYKKTQRGRAGNEQPYRSEKAGAETRFRGPKEKCAKRSQACAKEVARAEAAEVEQVRNSVGASRGVGVRLAHRRRLRPYFCGSDRLLLFNPSVRGPTA